MWPTLGRWLRCAPDRLSPVIKTFRHGTLLARLRALFRMVLFGMQVWLAPRTISKVILRTVIACVCLFSGLSRFLPAWIRVAPSPLTYTI